MDITAEQLRVWADTVAGFLDNDDPDAIDRLFNELRRAADGLENLDHILESVPEVPAGTYTWPPHPRFLTAARWAVSGYRGAWFLVGRASDLLGVQSVVVHRAHGPAALVSPCDVVGWRRVQRKGGKILYLVMTFESVMDDAQDTEDDERRALEDGMPEWTLS